MTAAASSPRLLIVGVTGRALAASAFRWGRAVVVLDLFADRDTRELATECREVSAPVALRFHQGRLLAAARALAPDAPLVYGSGFEGQIELLARLAHGLGPPALHRVAQRLVCDHDTGRVAMARRVGEDLDPNKAAVHG